MYNSTQSFGFSERNGSHYSTERTNYKSATIVKIIVIPGSLRKLEDLDFKNEKTISKMTWEPVISSRKAFADSGHRQRLGFGNVQWFLVDERGQLHTFNNLHPGHIATQRHISYQSSWADVGILKYNCKICGLGTQVECLCWKQEDLSSIPKRVKLNTAVCPSSFSTEGWRQLHKDP